MALVGVFEELGLGRLAEAARDPSLSGGVDLAQELTSRAGLAQQLRALLGRAGSIELIGAVLADSLGLTDVCLADLRNARALLVASEPERERLAAVVREILPAREELRAVLLISCELGSLFALSVLEEVGTAAGRLRALREAEEQALESSIGRASALLAGQPGTQEELVRGLEQESDLLRYLSLSDERIRPELEALLGGGTSEEELSLGATRLTMLHEEFHVRRVNALRRAGLGLALAQRAAELHGGAVRAGWGC